MTSGGGSTFEPGERAEILDLYSRWAFAIDFGDGSDWPDCYTVDGRFASDWVQDVATVNVRGRAQLLEFALKHRAGPHGTVMHHFTNISVQPAPSGAIGRAVALYAVGGNLTGAGRYDDELISQNGVWLFSRRQVTLIN